MATSFFSRFWRSIGELYNKKGESVLRYRGRDGKVHYVATSEDPTGGASAQIQVVEVDGTDPEQELAPNTFYKFGSVNSITLTLGTPTSGVLNVYSFAFTASESFDPSEDLSLPEDVLLNDEIKMVAGDECEVSIRDNRATFTVWSVPDEPIAGE